MTSADLKSFRLFLESPIHNQHKELPKLVQFILQLPEGLPAKDQKPALWAQLNPHLPYNDLRIRHLLSLLNQRLESFFIWQETQKDPLLARKLLVKAYQTRKWERPRTHAMRAYQKSLRAAPHRDPEFFQHEFTHHLFHYNHGVSREDVTPETLQQLTDSLDLYYLAQKLKQACNLLTHQRVYQAGFEMPLLAALIEQVEQEKLYEEPAVGLYYFTYQSLVEPSVEQWFFTLRDALATHFDQLPQEEIRGLYLYGFNYCIEKLNQGQEEYLRIVFDLYKEALENESLFDQGQLTPWTYKNIAAAGLKLKEFEWVEGFLDQYRDNLPEEFRDSLYGFSLARLKASMGQFSGVVRLLAPLYVRDTFTQLDVKVLLVKAYYELGEFELIEATLSSFQQLVRRREIQTYHRGVYKQFIRFTRKLINLKPFDKAAHAALLHQMASVAQLPEKEWLQEKIEEMG